jgi:hypothetical protein
MNNPFKTGIKLATLTIDSALLKPAVCVEFTHMKLAQKLSKCHYRLAQRFLECVCEIHETVFISHFYPQLAYKPSFFTESTRSTKCLVCVHDSWSASKYQTGAPLPVLQLTASFKEPELKI